MDKVLKIIDDLIDKIPPHLRDIMQKAGIALGALLVLFGILYGAMKGSEDAKPSGFQLAGSDKDLFYLEELREQNFRKKRLIEDVPVETDEMNSMETTDFQYLNEKPSNHLIGDNEMIEKKEPLRSKSEFLPMLSTDNEMMDPEISEKEKTKEMKNSSTEFSENSEKISEISLPQEKLKTNENLQPSGTDQSLEQNTENSKKNNNLMFIE